VRGFAALVAGVALCLLAASARTEQAPPPDQGIGGGTELGFRTFQTKCMNCHGNPAVSQAPSPSAIRQMSPERIYEALTTGPMKAQGAALKDSEKRMLAAFMSGRPLGSTSSGDAALMAGRCPTNPPLKAPDRSSDWIGWSPAVDNARFQPHPGLSKADVPRLKLKWAFGFPDGLSAYGQPTVAGGRVFVGTDTGYVYSLDAQTGCVYWSYKAKAAVRGAVTLGLIGAGKSARWGVFFGDFQTHAYGLDAHTGKEIWTAKVDDHFVTRVTAGPTYYAGKVFVSVSSSEGFSASTLDYPCCTSRGSVVALDAATGRRLWKAWSMDEPKPTHRNSRGVQLYAPSGGPVWNSPTVDPVRGAVYFGTGDSATEPAPPTTDAIIAVDIKTGKRLWTYQTLADDAFLGGCFGPTKTEHCPKNPGPDYDIGNSPVLTKLAGGKRALLVGTKDGYVIALDPDRKGALLWKHKISLTGGRGGGRTGGGGVYWGGAADQDKAYYGLATGGMAAVRLADGAEAWVTPIPGGVNTSAATSAIPGVAFVGGMDGKLRALSTSDGNPVWEFDTAQDFDTVNKVRAHGGGIGSAGPTIAGGMLYVGSGYAVVGEKTGNVLLAFAPQ
jgi:polyvinyl alcohol dehydrogenase (cytochrome)